MCKFWKRLFHRHVWKDIDETYLREEREPLSSTIVTGYGQFKYTAIKQKCVVCDTERTIEKRTWLI